MNQTILFAGGGTLGPVTPLLAISSVLRSRRPDWEQIWVGTPDGPEIPLVRPRMTYLSVPVVKLRRYASLETLRDLGKFPGVLKQARDIVQRTKPSIVVGAGGFVSVPMGWAAKWHHAKLLIHQQDVEPGLANRLLAPWADQITTVFGAHRTFPPKKCTQTGNPVRQEFLQADAARGRSQFAIPADRPMVLVIGGGTGAQALNTLVEASRPRLQSTMTIVHLTGAHRGHAECTEDGYIRRAFLDAELPHVMAAADLVVTRAGMGTLTELSALAKPTIIIPMPKTHQEYNAAALEASRAAVVLSQTELTPEIFTESVQTLMANAPRRHELSGAMAAWNKPDAAGTIAGMIERLLLS